MLKIGTLDTKLIFILFRAEATSYGEEEEEEEEEERGRGREEGGGAP